MNGNVVITGSGVISAVGIGKEAAWEALKNGRSGITSPLYLNTSHSEFPVGEVKISNTGLYQKLQLQGECPSRTVLLGIAAAREAVKDAGITEILAEETGERRKRIAFISGTTVAGMDQTEKYYPDRLSASLIRKHSCGNCSDSIADNLGNIDFVSTSSTACSSALNAIIFGKQLIESRLYDIVIAGGTESLSCFHLNGFKSLMILDQELCRPFDKSRSGLNLGEGAAYIVMESDASAQERHIAPAFLLEGTGNACDAFHATASSPEGEGAYLAMTHALKEAGLQPEDIQYINAHGTGTLNNDSSESAAIRRLFYSQDDGKKPWVSSTKGFTGHTTSASGSIETTLCLLALEQQQIPVNINWKEYDSNCIRPYMGESLSSPLRHILCNAFGFGGNDSSIIIGRYHE